MTTDSFSPRRSDFLETLLYSQPQSTAELAGGQEISRGTNATKRQEKQLYFARIADSPGPTTRDATRPKIRHFVECRYPTQNHIWFGASHIRDRVWISIGTQRGMHYCSREFVQCGGVITSETSASELAFNKVMLKTRSAPSSSAARCFSMNRSCWS